jgi:hypothetical protein
VEEEQWEIEREIVQLLILRATARCMVMRLHHDDRISGLLSALRGLVGSTYNLQCLWDPSTNEEAKHHRIGGWRCASNTCKYVPSAWCGMVEICGGSHLPGLTTSILDHTLPRVHLEESPLFLFSTSTSQLLTRQTTTLQYGVFSEW